MRTGKWRDAGIACAVVLAWHLTLGWVLLRQSRIEPTRAADDAIRVVFIQTQVETPMIRSSTAVPRNNRQAARRASRRVLPVATTSPPAAKALPDGLPSQSMSAMFLDQARAEARRRAPIDFGARDPFATRPKQLPTPGAGRFQMRPMRSPKDLVAAVGGYLLAPRGYDADPCPRNRENIGNLMAAGDSAALWQEMEFDRRHCRP
jgi:hypothetical protein